MRGSRNIAERVPGERQTNNRGELLVRLSLSSPSGPITERLGAVVDHTCDRGMSSPQAPTGNTYRFAIFHHV